MISLDLLEYRYFNARDIEIPFLLTFLKDFGSNIDTLLDVGAHASCDSYAPAVAEFMKEKKAYHAIDILPDPKTAQIVDQWYTGNFINFGLEKDPGYDCVISVSAIEHAGITTYIEGKPAQQRALFFINMLTASQGLVFLTFPFGQPGGTPKQYDNITEFELGVFEKFAVAYNFKPLFQEFYFNAFPQEKRKWMRVSREECAEVPYDHRIEQQTVACVAWSK